MAGCPSERSSSWHRARWTRFVAGGALAFVLSFGAAAFAATTKAAPGKVTAVRFWSLGEVTRVAIEVSSEFKYKSERLTNPDRLFFDIQGAKPEMVAKGMHVITVGDSLVKQIRIAETTPGVTRVVLDLAQSAAFTASQLSSPDRLMVEIRLKDGAAPPAPPATTSTSGSKLLTESPLHSVEPDLVATSVVGSAPTVVTSVPAAIVATPVVTPAVAATVPVSNLKPERARLKPFEPPPLRPDAPRTESKPELIRPPAFDTIAKAPKDPLPPPSVKPDATLVASNRGVVPNGAPVGPIRPAAVTDPGPTSKETKLEPGKEPLPAKSGANGSRSLTRVLGLKLGRVVIDPGHGGHDVGTHGPSGLAEKEVVLDVAMRLGKLLEDRLSSEVVYTRSNDTFIPLEERTHIANEHKADLFLSIHANSSPYHSAAGVETYYLNFTTSRTAMDLAARENASSERSVFELKEILQKIALKDKIDESREFAASLQKSLYGVSSKGNVDAKNRGIKKAPFVVLIGASMPSVLAEIGFLTNSADEALLRKPDHRQKIAEALYKGIASYADTLSHFQVAKRD
jgi:N-acetylmuramoyl-L-alanine amidase